MGLSERLAKKADAAGTLSKRELKMLLAESDVLLPRIMEDLFATLVKKKLIRWSDLPDRPREILEARQDLHEALAVADVCHDVSISPCRTCDVKDEPKCRKTCTVLACFRKGMISTGSRSDINSSPAKHQRSYKGNGHE
jgi:hypothetical protein